MAWNDIIQTEKYQGLSQEEQANAKQKYWDTVAAPKVEAAGKDVESFKNAFFNTNETNKGLTTPDPLYKPKTVAEVDGGAQIQDQNLSWLKKAASQETIDRYEAKGSIGMVEAYERLNKWEMLPFLSGVATYDDIKVFRTMQKAQKGEQISEQENAELQEFVNDMIEVEARGYSWAGGVTNALLQMPAFAVEFMATGGAVTVGKKALSKGAKELVETSVEKTLKQRIAAGTTEKVGTAMARTALMPHRVADSHYNRRINNSIAITDKGEVLFKEAKEKPGITFMKAIGDVFIENLSEDLGGALITPALNKVGAGIRRVGQPVKRVIPETIRQGFSELVQSTTNTSVREAFEKIGYNGLLEEIGEERIGALLRTSFDIDSEEGYSTQQFLDAAFPDADEFLIEVGAIAAFGGISRSTQTITNHLRNRQTPESEIEQVIANTSETEKDDIAARISQRETDDQIAGFEQELTRIQDQVVGAGRSIAEAEAFTGLLEARTAAMADALNIPRENIIKRFGLEIQSAQSGIVQDLGVNLTEQEMEDIPFFQSADAYNAEGEVKTESPQFKRWFGDSKVTSYGNPLEVYHGSTVMFEEFDRKFAENEGNLGGGFYFSSSEDDVETNYRGGGRDFETKVERDAERIAAEEDRDVEDVIEELRNQRMQDSVIHEVYLKMEKPFYIGDNESRLFETFEEDALDQAGIQESDFESEEEFYDARNDAIDAWYEEVQDDVVNALNDLVDYDVITGTIMPALQDSFYEGGITFEQLRERLGDELIEDFDTGEIVNSEVIRRIVESQGYDGIIDSTVSDKFANMNIEPGTSHYVVFNPEQIKSTDNKGRFDPESKNIFEQFAGENAETASKFKLKTAQRMLNAGMSPELVRKTTGWFKGADGKFRFEIDDADAKLSIEDGFKASIDLTFGTNLGDIFDHEKLYAAYPEFKDITVKFSDRIGNADAAAFGLGNSILINDKYRNEMGDPEVLEELESIVLHELQHFIQAKEEFATGGSPQQFENEFKSIKKAEDQDITSIRNDLAVPLFEDIYEFTGDRTIPPLAFSELEIDSVVELLKSTDKNNRTEKEIKDFIESSEYYEFMNDNIKEMRENHAKNRANLGFDEFDTYHRLYGEVEARNVQKRAKLSAAERRKISPQSTQDVADNAIIVKFDDGTSVSAPSLLVDTPVSVDGLEVNEIQDIQELLLQAAANKGVTVDKLNINDTQDLVDTFKFKKQAQPKSLYDKLKSAGFYKESEVLKDYALLMGFDKKIGRGHILRPKGKIIDETDLQEFLVVNGYMTQEQVADRANVEFALENSEKTYTEEEQQAIDNNALNAQAAEIAANRASQYSVDEINQVKDLLVDSLNTKGSIEFNRQQATIKLFDSADTSTLFHELGHLFLRDMEFYAEQAGSQEIKKQLDAFNTWLDYDGQSELSTEQHEKFARGFEAYLRTGKAPKKELQGLFDRLKEWLRSIYASAKQLNVEMSPDVIAAFDNLFKTKEDIQKERREMDALYDQNLEVRDYVNDRSIWYNGKDSIYKKKNFLSTLYDNALMPIESLAANISPDLFKKMREHSFAIHRMAGKDTKIVKPFLEKSQKMAIDDFDTLDLALKNRDNDKVDQLAKKYDMVKELNDVRDLLDEIYASAQDAGIELGYLDSYFPRMFRNDNVAGLIDLVERRKNQEEYDIKQLKLNPKDAKYTNLWRELQKHPEWTSEQQAQFVNMNIRGFTGNMIFLSSIGNLKHERSVDMVDGEMNQFYMPFTEALMTYVSSARENIANKKFFGAERKEVKDIRTNIKRTQTDIQKLQDQRKELNGINNPEVNDQRKNLSEKINKKYERLSELNSILDSKKDSTLEDSIGSYVADMVSTGVIYAKDQQLVKDILKAKFDQQGIGKWGVVRDAGYIATLNDFANTLTQFGDLALSAYKNGALNSIAGITTQKKITKEDLGIDKMLAEFGTEKNILSKWLEKQFKFIGFDMVDSLGKNSIINGSILKNKKLAEKNSSELDQKLQFWFMDDKQRQQVKQDLLNDEISDDVIFLAFNDLADLQPISPDQLPIAYSKGGLYRLMYALKTYTLKMLDIMRKDIFKELPRNPKKALKNLVMLQAMLLLFGVPKDLAKNILSGEDEEIGETFANNFIVFTVLSKYSLRKLFGEGQENTKMDFAVNLMTPPIVDIGRGIEKDLEKLADGKKDINEVYSARYIPFIGEGYYWWFGRGAELKEEKK